MSDTYKDSRKHVIRTAKWSATGRQDFYFRASDNERQRPRAFRIQEFKKVRNEKLD